MHPSVHSSSIYNRKTWKQTKHPLADEWIKMCYIYTMEYYLAISKNKTMPFAATWRDLTIIILRQRKRNIIWYHLYCCSVTKLCPTLWGLMDCRTHITCMWNLKKKIQHTSDYNKKEKISIIPMKLLLDSNMSEDFLDFITLFLDNPSNAMPSPPCASWFLHPYQSLSYPSLLAPLQA